MSVLFTFLVLLLSTFNNKHVCSLMLVNLNASTHFQLKFCLAVKRMSLTKNKKPIKIRGVLTIIPLHTRTY